MKLYLAGPMSGLPDHNRPAFMDAAQALRARGHQVLNPAEWDEDIDESADLPWEWYLRRDLAKFLDPEFGAEAVVVLPRWEESRGANLEVAVAHRLGIEVYEYRGGFLGAQVLGPLAEPDPGPAVYEWSTPIVSSFRWEPDEAVVGDDPRERSLGGAAQDEEVIVTDPTTGGQKGQKLAQIGALDPLALLEVGRVAGFGARKYDRFNYLRGYAWSLSFDAGERHRMAHWAGEERDPESGLYHLAHAAWHDLAQLSFLLRDIGTDDRPPPLDRGE